MIRHLRSTSWGLWHPLHPGGFERSEREVQAEPFRHILYPLELPPRYRQIASVCMQAEQDFRNMAARSVSGGPSSRTSPKAGGQGMPVRATTLVRSGSMNLPRPADSGVPAVHPDMCIVRIRRNHLLEVQPIPLANSLCSCHLISAQFPVLLVCEIWPPRPETFLVFCLFHHTYVCSSNLSGLACSAVCFQALQLLTRQLNLAMLVSHCVRSCNWQASPCANPNTHRSDGILTHGAPGSDSIRLIEPLCSQSMQYWVAACRMRWMRWRGS